MLDVRRITLFCLEKRLSKHKMTIFSKNLGRPWPLWPPLVTPMIFMILQKTYIFPKSFYAVASRVDPVSEVRGAISVIFGGRVS